MSKTDDTSTSMYLFKGKMVTVEVSHWKLDDEVSFTYSVDGKLNCFYHALQLVGMPLELCNNFCDEYSSDEHVARFHKPKDPSKFIHILKVLKAHFEELDKRYCVVCKQPMLETVLGHEGTCLMCHVENVKLNAELQQEDLC